MASRDATLDRVPESAAPDLAFGPWAARIRVRAGDLIEPPAGRLSMHETSVMQARAQQAGATHMPRVDLAISPTEQLTEEVARRHFAALAAGTIATDAALVFTVVPGTYRCIGCGTCFASPESEGVCTGCGSPVLAIPGQDGCSLDAIEVICAAGDPAMS